MQRRLDARLERAVIGRADLVTTVTDEITDDLRARFGAEAVTLPNGFDPDETVNGGPYDCGLDPARHSIVHTGRMAFSGLSPRPILEALEILRSRQPDLVSRTELVFAGPLSGDERHQIEAAGKDGSVRAVGTLARQETLRLQSAADTLLLLTGRGRRSEATAKLYEYLAAGRPILVLGEGSAAARIVSETASGSVAAADDPSAIAHALADAVLRPKTVAEPNEAAGRYSYERIAARLSDHVQQLVAAGHR